MQMVGASQSGVSLLASFSATDRDWLGSRLFTVVIEEFADRRVLIIVAARAKRVQSYDETQIANIERVERADGPGDLAFARELHRDSEGGHRPTDVKFVGISDVRSVEDLLRKTFHKE